MDDSISAAIAVAATVEDFRVSANVAQVMGNTKYVNVQNNSSFWCLFHLQYCALCQSCSILPPPYPSYTHTHTHTHTYTHTHTHSLLVTHLKCQAHADISHNELVMFNLDGRMVKGEVDARGGVIAGSILMEDVQAHGERA